MYLNENINLLELNQEELLLIDGGLDVGKIVSGVGYSIAAVGAAAVAVYAPDPMAKYGAATASVGFAYYAANNLYHGFKN